MYPTMTWHDETPAQMRIARADAQARPQSLDAATLARGLTRGPARPEIEEQDLISRRIPRSEFERMVRDGEIRDAISVAAWGLLLMKGLV